MRIYFENSIIYNNNKDELIIIIINNEEGGYEVKCILLPSGRRIRRKSFRARLKRDMARKFQMISWRIFEIARFSENKRPNLVNFAFAKRPNFCIFLRALSINV